MKNLVLSFVALLSLVASADSFLDPWEWSDVSKTVQSSAIAGSESTVDWIIKQDGLSAAIWFVQRNGTVESNGFGGGGGFLFCPKLRSRGIRYGDCRSLIEKGFRFSRRLGDPELNFSGDSTSMLGLRLSELSSETPFPEDLGGEIHSLHKIMEENDITDRFQQFVMHSIFGYSRPQSHLNVMSFEEFVEDEYRESVFRGASREYMGLINSLDENLGLFRVQPMAISERFDTYFFEQFFELGPKQQLMIFVHEALMRNCYLFVRDQCLSETLYYEGIIYDLLLGRELSGEQKQDLYNYFDWYRY